MKKFISLLLVLVLTISFCFGSGLTVFAESPNDSKASADGFDKDKTSFELLNEMKIGWNLGNTLEAFGATGLDSETSWGNPKTTEKMILDVKEMGFNTIRIPVSWGIHADSEGNIDIEWLSRVKEVVNYAYNNDMYVILNSHHDNSYYDIGACVESNDAYKTNINKMSKLWTNIAEAFKDYNERLLFETMNEPRNEGSEKEWLGGTAEEREIVYALNDACVKAIRATGGNNEYRHIIVPGYAASSSKNILREMKLPDDDRIIFSVHAYIPYSFAMDDNGPSEFTNADKTEINRLFSELNKIFISKDIPVIIGEFGAVNKNNIDARCAWADYYIKCAGQYGIPCAVWDNNIADKAGEERYGLYNRNSGEWTVPELAQTIVKAADEAFNQTKETNNHSKFLPIIFAVSAVVVLVLGIIISKLKKRK